MRAMNLGGREGSEHFSHISRVFFFFLSTLLTLLFAFCLSKLSEAVAEDKKKGQSWSFSPSLTLRKYVRAINIPKRKERRKERRRLIYGFSHLCV